MIKQTAQAGFSLVEILLVILVSGAIILVLVNVLPAVNLVGVGNRELIVRQVVAEEIEDLRSQGFDYLSEGSTNLSDTRLDPFPQVDATITITPYANEIKQVDITVNWIENNKLKTFTTSTLVAKGGIK